MKKGKFLAIVMFAVTVLMTGAWAQSSDYPQQPQNQQGPGGPGPNDESATRSEGPAPDVARISLIKGDVSSQRADTGDWSVTSVNAPVMRGDQVATGEGARTEVQLNYANIVRLAGRSQVKLADLSRNRIQLQVAQGYAFYSMLKGNEADVEIDTPNVAVHPLRTGRYRVQVISDSETDVIVREGEAEITTPEGSTRVEEGHMISIRGTDSPEYKIADAPIRDDWDQWNKDRDGMINTSQSVSHTNRYYTGVNDLDSNGRWVYVPGYGNVWQPYQQDQQADWAPYQSGRWVWQGYYGWTWVSYEPWGWAPYHYGRWLVYGGNWCWWPGPVYASYRPVWSPAFVFFVGFGGHAGFGYGSIGWFPVGPHDYYYPWYGRGFNRVNVVNVTNINIVNGRGGAFVAPLAVRGHQPFFSNARLVGTNARVRGSITTVSTADFGRGDFHNRRFGVNQNEWREGRVMTANLPVVPSRDNLRVARTDGGLPSSIHPRSNDRFYTQHQPPARPESFHDQMARVQRVVRPEGNVRTDMNAGPGHVERRDVSGTPGGNMNSRGNANERIGNAQIPRNDVSRPDRSTNDRSINDRVNNDRPNNDRPTGGVNNDSSRGDSGRFGRPENNSSPGPKDSPGRMAPGANEGMAQNNPPSNNNSNSAQDNRQNNRDRGGWSKFGSPSGRSGGDNSGNPGNNNRSEQNSAPTTRSNDQGRVPRSESSNPPQQEDRGGWQRFPSNNGSRPNDSPANRNNNDRSNNERGNNDRGNSGAGSKPPLELHRPIVTPRQDSRPDNRNDQGYRPPPPSRTPDVRNEPRNSPPPQRSERSSPPQRNERYSPPQRSERSSPPQRNERYSPPQRSERYSPPSRSESRGGNSSSSHGGSGERGSHNDSKSSSDHKR